MDQDQATLSQMDAIQQEVAESQPLVGPRAAVADLLQEYEDDVFKRKIQNLSEKMPEMRKTRGDGNCFYRAYAYGIAEHLVNHQEQLAGFLERLRGTYDMAIATGYPDFTTEDFYENFDDEFKKLEGGTLDAVHAMFNDSGLSNYFVAYLRIITGAYMKAHPDDFLVFLPDGHSIDTFCSSQVDPFGIDCEHVQIMALTQALGIGVAISYLDRSEGDSVHTHAMPDGASIQIPLLYRPGHYDILYTPA